MTCASARVIPGWVKVGRTSLGTGDLGARVSARNSSRNIFLDSRASSALPTAIGVEHRQSPGGPSKVCEFWGRLPHGVPRADFFWRGQTFDYFLEIKDFKRRPRSPSGSSASLFNGLRPASALHQQHCRVGEANIFPTRPRLPGGASQSSAGSYGRPRGRRTRFSAKFRKLFLPPRSRKKRREIQGGGGG
jgi:hypothetical protein